MMRHLRSIIRITSMDKRTNKEILERTGLPSMEDLLIRKNLRWTGHLLRMSPDRLSKQVLYCQLSHIKRGRPRLRFNDTINRNLKLRNIKIDSWMSLSQQRDKWRATFKRRKQSLLHRDRQYDERQVRMILFRRPIWFITNRLTNTFTLWRKYLSICRHYVTCPHMSILRHV